VTSNAVVVVKLGGQRSASRVFEVLHQLGVALEPAPPDRGLIPAGALGFQVARDRASEVMLALECAGFSDVRAYEAGPPE
jgi:hypothetical protein